MTGLRRPAPLPSESPRDGSRATLADVAREAGVSTATASRALSGRGVCAPATRQRVAAVASLLDFEPSAAGRSLRLQRSHLIGFVVPDISSAFYAGALKGAQRRLATAGYGVVLMDTDERPEQSLEAVRRLAAQGVDGAIVCSSGESPEALRALVQRTRLPVILFDNLVPGVGQGSVTLANEAGTRLLVDHLEMVHARRRIAYVGGLVSETSGLERRTGFRLGRAANGLPEVAGYERGGDWTYEAGRTETAALIDHPEPPDAIVYAAGLMALGGLALLRERGVRVPDEVAIVSFDDWEGGGLLDPPLTALGRRDRQIGDLAASLLLRIFEREEGGSMELRIPMELVIRRSCGCVPQRER